MGDSVQGVWSHEEVSESINWRELKAIELTLQSFRSLKNCTILIRSDNTTATSYINKQGGTRSQSLSRLATSIWEMCLKRGILLQAQHIPGHLNTEADLASRHFFTKNMWQIRPWTYQTIIQPQFGKNDVDLFADRTSHLLPQYVSWKKDPQAIATDALTIPWQKFQRPLIHPPWNLITICLRKLLVNPVPATVIVPYWPSAVWYPLLQQMSKSPPLLLDPRARAQTTSPLSHWPWTNRDWKISVWAV